MSTRQRHGQCDVAQGSSGELPSLLPQSYAREAYLPLKDLAAYAGLSVRTLRNYLSRPSQPLPCYRLGGKVLVRRSEFDSWMATFRQVAVNRVDTIVADVVKGL